MVGSTEKFIQAVDSASARPKLTLDSHVGACPGKQSCRRGDQHPDTISRNSNNKGSSLKHGGHLF